MVLGSQGRALPLIIMLTAFVCPDTIVGMTDASMTRSPGYAVQPQPSSTTAIGSAPIRQLPIGGTDVSPWLRT